MKDAYYFSHDSNARHDPKISAMRGVYGAEGYGWYWMLVEMMRDSDGYKLDMQAKYAFNAYASQLHADRTRIEEFVKDCIHEFGLFDSDGTYFWSNSLLRRMQKREEVASKKSKAAKARWNKEKQQAAETPQDAPNMHMHNISSADGMQGKESKVKESKGKENIKELCADPPADQHEPASIPDENDTGEKESKPPKYTEDSTYYRMALYFKSRVDEMAEAEGLTHLTARTNLQKWADDFRLLVERDGHDDKQLIQQVMDWVVAHPFWRSNVLSASKFREQWPKLVLEMRKPKPQQRAGYRGGPEKPKIDVVPAATGGEPNVSEAEFDEMMKLAREMQESKGGRR